MPRFLRASQRPSRRGNRGFSLIEVSVAVAIFLVVFAAFVTLVQVTSVSLVRSKERIASERLAQFAISRLKSIPFWDLTPAITIAPWGVGPLDSDLPDFGVPAGNYGRISSESPEYPSLDVLEEILSRVRDADFDRFTIDVRYWRRKLNPGVGEGYDLVLFNPKVDNAPSADDDDGRVRYWDQNTDHDFNDVFTSTEAWPYQGELMSELPSTNIREIIVTIFKDGRRITDKSSMVNLGLFSGTRNISAETFMSIQVASPSHRSALYRLGNPGSPTFNAYNLDISTAYPPWIRSWRFDNAGDPLPVQGITQKNASVKIAGMAGPQVMQSTTALADGSWGSFLPTSVTSAYQPGANYFVAFSTLNESRSPNLVHEMIWDIEPPAIDAEGPTGTVKSSQPFVGARLYELEIATDVVSGIAPEVIRFEVNGDTVPFSYDDKTGWVFWASTTTLLPPVLSSTSFTPDYTVILGGGDYAMYKTSESWTFDVQIDNADATPPIIANCSAPDTWTVSVELYDLESGVDLSTVEMSIDGVPFVNGANIHQFWDAPNGRILFLGNQMSGPVTVEVNAANFAGIAMNTDIAWPSNGQCMVTP